MKPAPAACTAALALTLAWVAGSPAPVAGSAGPAPPSLSSSIPDGSGGTVVVWRDFRSATSYDLYAQRLNAAGAQQWAAGGVAVCAAAGDQTDPQIVSDGAGGAIVVWRDSRSGASRVYVQRLGAAGAPLWTADGVALCPAATLPSGPQMVSDGAGGAIVVWEDSRGSSRDVYARRVDALGVPQWAADGVALCTAAGQQTDPQIVSDGSGGAIVCWSDNRTGVDNDVYAQRVDPAGATQWSDGGVAICVAPGSQHHAQITSDGAGGAFLVWEDGRTTVDYDVYVQEIDADGVPQWDAGGVVLCTAERDQLLPRIVPDGAGGVIAAWEDYRAGSYLEADIYARRVDAAGTPLWDAGGVALCVALRGQRFPEILADGAGGAIVTWEDGRAGSSNDIYARRVDSTGMPQGTADGVAICTAADEQTRPRIVSDGTDGAILTWYDQRSTADTDIYAQRWTAGAVVWAADGVPVHIVPGVQRLPAACSDGAAGILVAWQEKRGANYDISVRRFDAAGTALWPAAIASAASYAQVNAAIAPDGAGGALVTWVDYRNGTDSDIYAQRVSSGGVPLWTAGGVAICVAPGDQVSPRLVPDGEGGAVVAWADGRVGAEFDVYARRVDGAGLPLWLDDGVALCAAAGNQLSPQLVPDGAGGAIVTWQDLRGGGSLASDVYARRVDAMGGPQWADDGVAVCAADGPQRFPQIAPDGAGGAVVAWEDRRGASADIYARRVDAAGVPQWAADGVALCVAAGTQDSPQLVPDGAGGAIACWRDGRGGAQYDIYARRVDAAGVPQWTADGVALCTEASLQDRPRLVSDGAGGAIAAWEDHRGGANSGSDIYARKVDAAGAPQWSAGGVALCTASGPQSFPAIAGDGAGGAFVAWADHRDGIEDFVYVQRIGGGGAPVFPDDGVTPTLISVVRVEAWPGRVRLVWHAGSGAGPGVTVHRATRAGGWIPAGDPVADGAGRLTFDDRAVIPGERYGYRLGWLEGGAERFSAETWVDVPRATGLALHGVFPGPAGGIRVSFALPDAAPATLALFDLAGRRVRWREVGSMGAGEWRVNLEGGRVAAGAYVLRLTHGGRSVTRRIALIW